MPNIDVQDIDHLGIIAGIIDEIGIVEIIDQELLPSQCRIIHKSEDN